MKTDRKSQISFTRPEFLALALGLGLGLFAGCHRAPPPLTPEQAEQVFIKKVSTSGQVPPELLNILEPKVKDLWIASSELGLANLRHSGRDPSDLRSVGAISCFKDGCIQELRFKDLRAAMIYEEDVLIGPRSPLRHWPGRIYRGPLISGDDGVVRATWGLLIDPSHHRALKALSTDTHVETIDRSHVKSAISDLQRGDQ